MKPQLVEIITWNDDGSSQWAKGFPHGEWRIISKPYIEAYKSGATSPNVESDQTVCWYHPTPKGVTCEKEPSQPAKRNFNAIG
ncbi:uncharacterized protein N7473_011100 [Penicillium subrubescens]|uniref:uncharacterized protein n=1 Tax=Penicillium subrubescens TaxID=1316194 RepID=UPI0025450E9F|nr:uncharacterized protein N7473_011100 [Penicillium subrubescens]KAJ5882838.1 hypothetical protein N7473_011100 [Penicillium subrubescens]